jgi:hypothetical protein
MLLVDVNENLAISRQIFNKNKLYLFLGSTKLAHSVSQNKHRQNKNEKKWINKETKLWIEKEGKKRNENTKDYGFQKENK